MANPRPDRLREYSEVVDFGLLVGEGLGLPEARETIAALQLTDEETEVLRILDEIVVEYFSDQDHWIDNYVLRDNPTQPLSHWWWHLGKLRAGTYPAELLLEHLREIYRQQAAPDRVKGNALPI
jgi:hypothetical protein